MRAKRKYTSIDEQIQLLKSRGLIISDEQRSHRYLLTNNYYNIINGYSKYFQNKPDVFIPLATFDEVSRLYFYDKEIKQIFLNSILSAEHHLKSVLAHRFAEAYPNKRYGYLDVGCYQDKSILNIAYTISRISNVIKESKKYKENSVSYYVDNYDDVPIWVIVDHLDFGDIQSMVRALPISIQNNIAKDMSGFLGENLNVQNVYLPPEVLNSFIGNIRETRNVCAHGNRLLDFKCRASAKYFPDLHDKFCFSEGSERRSVYDVFISLQCFLSRTEYYVLYNSLRKRTRTLANHLCSISINDISVHLGFPTDWQNGPTLIQ
ncbi:Abi family protein [Schleiferilactobacillus harbinensis]|uniref:Abi family protein n=1 Tax=Schleiferilactobacillus harbinensis TaxID=304207 RepID=A0ABU7T356_9LACO